MSGLRRACEHKLPSLCLETSPCLPSAPHRARGEAILCLFRAQAANDPGFDICIASENAAVAVTVAFWQFTGTASVAIMA
jgi:hypothetical protein